MAETRVTISDLREGFKISAGEKSRLVCILPRCVRMVGLHFQTNKTFILPDSLVSIPTIKKVYEEVGESELLIVGHTDASGEPKVNDPLSLERANMVAAYLKDDVQVWMNEYSTSLPKSRRWSSLEDSLMIRSLADYKDKDPSSPDVEWFQSTRGLVADNIAGKNTREALITEYMSFDNTTLPNNIKVETHGCGEYFPSASAENSSAGESNAEDRRVELFFFPLPGGIDPKPSSKNSEKASVEYSQWLASTNKFIDLQPGEAPELEQCDIYLLDYDGEKMASAEWEISHGGQVIASGVSDDSGVASAALNKSYKGVMLRWRYAAQDNSQSSFPFSKIIYLNAGGDEDLSGILHNLGYTLFDDEKANVEDFQISLGLPITGNIEDIADELISWHESGDSPSLSVEPGSQESDDDEDVAMFSDMAPCCCADEE